MVSAEVLHKNPFFSKLSQDQLNYLVSSAQEITVGAGNFICEINQKLDYFFLIVEGQMEILFELPKIQVDYESVGHPSNLVKEFVRIAKIGTGDICGWSGLVPPYIATSSVRAITKSQIISFDSKVLLKYMEEDCSFGYFLFRAAAQAIRKRLKAVYDQ
jgi:CRP-like cAMP-binding protein